MKRNNDNRAQNQYKGYLYLSIIYAILLVTAQAMAYRLIQVGPLLEPGGIFIFPATFAISDVIAEVYGPTLARQTIFSALLAQAFFTFVPIFVNTLPAPPSWHYYEDYQLIFGSSWLIFISNVVAVLIGMILNTQIIGKTKGKTRGTLFAPRSVFSSGIGELISTFIIAVIALMPVVGVHTGLHLFINMFLFKLMFSLVVSYPASILVNSFKKFDQCDVYEENVVLNPLSKISFFKKNSALRNVTNINSWRKKNG